ncbi:hypothetical protein [Vibrio sp. SCSIO 43137]|uniref:hypothetical protein n=1 Tax=Vibrio sp. SCSIO 43137 TaxID=3021011 RepID=UPI0023076A7A|nr:hypothetical protein [Vibrio sp. SCSIO 43137]WCE29686.1 hypothetical protein PK654_15495 [Vibrio sp. SCSIO 43137]
MRYITDEQIEEGKRATKYSEPTDIVHEHNDCIRIAYEWLDAQKKIKNTSNKIRPIKHYIERWAGRYVSTSDVEVAATIHPDIQGKYPFFNLSARLTMPSTDRLKMISEAFTQAYNERHAPSIYAYFE